MSKRRDDSDQRQEKKGMTLAQNKKEMKKVTLVEKRERERR